MFPWDHRTSHMYAQVATTADVFTPQEEERLRSLRTHAQALRASEEHGLDRKRLTFARWLVEHGRLSDGV